MSISSVSYTPRASNYPEDHDTDRTHQAYSTHRSITEQVNRHNTLVDTGVDTTTNNSLDSLLNAFKAAGEKFNLDDIIFVMLMCYQTAGDKANSLVNKMKNLEKYSRNLTSVADAYQDIQNYIKAQTDAQPPTPPPYSIDADQIVNGNPSTDPPTPPMSRLESALKNLGGWDGTDGTLQAAWDQMNAEVTKEMSVVDPSADTTTVTNDAKTFDGDSGLNITSTSSATAAAVQSLITSSSEAATNVNQTDTATLQGLNNNLQADMSMVANILDKMNQLYSTIARIGG